MKGTRVLLGVGSGKRPTSTKRRPAAAKGISAKAIRDLADMTPSIFEIEQLLGMLTPKYRMEVYFLRRRLRRAFKVIYKEHGVALRNPYWERLDADARDTPSAFDLEAWLEKLPGKYRMDVRYLRKDMVWAFKTLYKAYGVTLRNPWWRPRVTGRVKF